MRNAPLRGVSLVNTLITLAAIEVAAAQAVLILGNPPSADSKMGCGRFRLGKSNVFPDVRFKPVFRQDTIDIPYEI